MKKKFTPDTIYAHPGDKIAPFVFDEQVADVFADMVNRSIPGYAESLRMIEMFTRHFSQAQARYYDLGCSLGAASAAMLQGISQPGATVIAVDNSPAMIRRSKVNLKAINDAQIPLQLVCADIRDVHIQNAAMVVLNYTLQFVPPEQRAQMIQTIYDGLRPGGALILSEKIVFEDEHEQQFQTEYYYAFKQFHGYSDMEISQKRTALEHVLIPDSWETHRRRLIRAGFKSAHIWLQYFSFVSILAVK